MIDMARKKTSEKPVEETAPKKQRPPSRENYKYFYIPKDLAETIEAIAEEQDRSGSYMVKKACEAFVAEYRKKKQKE